jgi:hypothetical protein
VHLCDGGMDIIGANTRIHEITGASTITGVINKLVEFRRIYKDSGGIHLKLKNGNWFSNSKFNKKYDSPYYSSYYSLNMGTYMIRLHSMCVFSVLTS